jgi:hypothetical protein
VTDAPRIDKGQSIRVWVVISTLLMLGGLIWFLSQSWIDRGGSAIFGLFVHEYGHVLAMNRLGMGPAKVYIIPFLGGVARRASAMPEERVGRGAGVPGRTGLRPAGRHLPSSGYIATGTRRVDAGGLPHRRDQSGQSRALRRRWTAPRRWVPFWRASIPMSNGEPWC